MKKDQYMSIYKNSMIKITKFKGSKIVLAGVFIGVLVSLPFFAGAETVLRTGEKIFVEVDQIVDGDFYALGGTISVSGTIKGDIYAIGGTVTLNGDIEGDVMLVSGTSQIHASVADDVRILGGEVTIAEHVGGDVFVIGGVLHVLSTASIDGDIFFFGGEGEINGVIGGSIMGTSEFLRIDAPVAGNVDVRTSRGLTLGSRADIGGDVRYASVSEITRSPDAVVVGEVVRNSVSETDALNFRKLLIPFFMLLFAVLSLYLLFKKELQILSDNAIKSYGRNGLIGLGTVILAPIAAILLMVTVLGFLVGLMGLFFLAFLYVISFVLSSVVIGGVLRKLLTKSSQLSLVWIIAGVVVLHILLVIPLIGPFFVLAVFVITLGTLVHSLYKPTV